MRAAGQAYQEYHDAALAYKRLKQESAHREERLQELQEQEQELSAANLIEGEEEQLTQERDRFRASEKIAQGLREAYTALYDLAGGRAAIEQARTAMRALAPVARYGKEYERLSQRAESLYYDTEDLGLSIRQELDTLDDNPERAQQVEERLDMIRKLPAATARPSLKCCRRSIVSAKNCLSTKASRIRLKSYTSGPWNLLLPMMPRQQNCLNPAGSWRSALPNAWRSS